MKGKKSQSTNTLIALIVIIVLIIILIILIRTGLLQKLFEEVGKLSH